jgi:hypothetical protein
VTWTKGTSGNPRGRKPGDGTVHKIRLQIMEHTPAIIERLVTAALDGDTNAAKVLLSRVVPILRPEEMPVSLPEMTGASRSEMMRVVIDAIADGRLDMNRGGRFIAMLTPSVLDERAERVERMLEARNVDQPNDELSD